MKRTLAIGALLAAVSLSYAWAQSAGNTVTARGAPFVTQQVTIAAGTAPSSTLQLGGMMIAGVDLGAALTSTSFTIQNATDCTNFRNVTDSSGNALSWTVAGGRYIKFDPPLLGYVCLQVTPGSSEAAPRTLTFVLVP